MDFSNFFRKTVDFIDHGEILKQRLSKNRENNGRLAFKGNTRALKNCNWFCETEILVTNSLGLSDNDRMNEQAVAN